ncbi:MAG: DUF2029 domain-containing protein [Polyangiaceae bacterium]|nr:DUF2029 domain-containing protein [Polyangiaceae bacterium]
MNPRRDDKKARGELNTPAKLLAIGLIPACVLMILSVIQAEVIHGTWDRLNAVLAIVHPARSNVNDALPAMAAARSLLETPNAPIYDMTKTDTAAFLYPPIAAVLYIPHVVQEEFSSWSLVSTNRLVFLLIAMLVAAAWTGRRRWPSAVEAMGTLVLMAVFLPIARSLELNQASLYVALFLGAAWVSLDRGFDVAAGLFLALAGAVKPHLFAVAPLLVFHARKTAISAAIGAVFLGLTSLLVAGVENHVTYITHVLPTASRGYAFFPNQSMGGFLHRLLTDAPLDVFELSAPNPLVQRMTAAVGAAFYVSTFGLVLKARAHKWMRREVLALAWFVTTMIAPIAWGHHYAAAVFPLVWLIGRTQRGLEKDVSRLAPTAFGCALLGSYFVVTGLSGTGARLFASYGLVGALLSAGAFGRSLWVVARSPGAELAAVSERDAEPVLTRLRD